MKAKLEDEVKNVEDALKTDNTEAIKAATEKLSKVWNDAAQHIYSQQGPEGAPQDPTAGAGAPGADAEQGQSESTSEGDDKEVEDASYEVVDDDKDK